MVVLELSRIFLKDLHSHGRVLSIELLVEIPELALNQFGSASFTLILLLLHLDFFDPSSLIRVFGFH